MKTAALALAAALLAGPALAQTAPAAKPAPAAAQRLSVETTPINEIIRNPQGKAALERAIPQLPQFYNQVGSMTLVQLAPMSQGAINQAKLKEIQAEFDKIR